MNLQKRSLVQLEILIKSKKREAIAGSGCGRGRWIHDYNGKSKHGPTNSRMPI
uniref:Uncharacterized protein n=1 Tax=Naja naja TaxID=35670 RepID=A0A8C6VKF5_NAJNA